MQRFVYSKTGERKIIVTHEKVDGPDWFETPHAAAAAEELEKKKKKTKPKKVKKPSADE